MPEKPKEPKKVRCFRLTLAEWQGVKQYVKSRRSGVWIDTVPIMQAKREMLRKPVMKPKGRIA